MSALSDQAAQQHNFQRQSELQKTVRALFRSWSTRISAFFIIAFVIITVVPFGMWPESAHQSDLALRHVQPTIAGGDEGFFLGTDSLGRDVFFRTLMATELTLLIAGAAMVLATLTGTMAGLAAGYYRNWVDTIISRLVEMMIAFPVLLLVLALVAALGRSMFSVVIVLGISGWAGYTRVIRSSAMSLAQRDFVEAARAIGASNGRIIVRHLLPNVVSPMLVLSTFFLAQFILVESAISFLGLGPAPPDVTWGGLIGAGRDYIYEAWWVSLFPGVAIFIAVMAINMMGDAMRDAFDPHSQTAREF